jgi:NAD(P)-dependent dehydrogenase (short-subunit alcohol dehydrogenase family)
MVEAARRRWGRVDVLHYNVGVGIAGGDAPLDEITEDAFDRIAAVNLRGAIMTCKHVLPLMRAQRAGVIITISSVAAWEQYPNVVYKATKAGMIAFTQQVAIQNAEFGVRANVILPGLIDTPMAVDTRARASGKSRAEVAAARDARVPLRHKMGTPWDVAKTTRSSSWRRSALVVLVSPWPPQALAETAPTTLYAARGRLIPFNSNSPTGSTFTAFSTLVSTRALIRICPGLASSQRREATLDTVPIAA